MLCKSSSTNSPPKATKQLIDCLRDNGYATLTIDQPQEILEGIRGGLKEASKLNGFRFPDVAMGNTTYNDASRQCFCSLYDVATTAFIALCSSEPVQKSKPTFPPSLQKSITRIEQVMLDQKVGSNNNNNCYNRPSSLLFPVDSNRPFTTDDPTQNDDPFSSTFFNLFRYDHGMLNAHKDRGLLTVIASRLPPQGNYNEFDTNDIIINSNQRENTTTTGRSKLWLEHPHNTGEWIDLDEQIWTEPDDDDQQTTMRVLILMGEAGEKLFSSLLGLRAFRHTVRVHPTGDYVERSHYRHDPESSPDSNRVSAAMILNQELELEHN